MLVYYSLNIINFYFILKCAYVLSMFLWCITLPYTKASMLCLLDKLTWRNVKLTLLTWFIVNLTLLTWPSVKLSVLAQIIFKLMVLTRLKFSRHYWHDFMLSWHYWHQLMLRWPWLGMKPFVIFSSFTQKLVFFVMRTEKHFFQSHKFVETVPTLTVCLHALRCQVFQNPILAIEY